MTLQVSDNSDEVQESSKYLTFELANEHYGVDILRVREIIGLSSFTNSVTSYSAVCRPIHSIDTRISLCERSYEPLRFLGKFATLEICIENKSNARPR